MSAAFAEDSSGNKNAPAQPQIFTIPLSNDLDHVAVVNAENDPNTPHDFEEAIEATGYGRFNYLLLLALCPAGWTSIFDTTAMSYVLPAAECDLEMDLFHKGLLNAIVYTGMIASAFAWGFLADTKGRRSLLLVGYISDAICNILSSTSQTFWVLLTFKCLSGFIVSGPFAINMTYLAEFQTKDNRPRAIMWMGIFLSLGNVAVPALAWAIIPRPWSFTIFDGAVVYNSWRIFVLACSLPGLVAFAALMYFPESPKFLMSQGRNDEALKVFQRIYTMNTGKPADTFPIKVLCQECQQKKRTTDKLAKANVATLRDKARAGWKQITPLFGKPYLGPFVLIVIIQFGAILGMNTLRLWLPQLFTMMENFDYDSRDPSLGPPTLCEMITVGNATVNFEVDASNSTNMTNVCVPALIRDRVYINSMIPAAVTVVGYAFAGKIINLFGKKNLLLAAFLLPAICNFVFNWSPNSDVTLAIASVYITLTSISTMTIISFIVELMPTSLRTMAVSLTMCIGRIGAVCGNILFPVFLSMGCLIPFMVLGGFLLTCFVLSIFIPKPTGKLL